MASVNTRDFTRAQQFLNRPHWNKTGWTHCPRREAESMVESQRRSIFASATTASDAICVDCPNALVSESISNKEPVPETFVPREAAKRSPANADIGQFLLQFSGNSATRP